MKKSFNLVRAFPVFWTAGCLFVLAALFIGDPWSSHAIRAGLACVCVGCCVNAASAFLARRMWGRFSVITPDSISGGKPAFFAISIIYSILAVVCGFGAATFAPKAL